MKSFIAIGDSLNNEKRWEIVSLRSSIDSLPTEGTGFFCPYDICEDSGPTAPPTTEPNKGRLVGCVVLSGTRAIFDYAAPNKGRQPPALEYFQPRRLPWC
ncbi:hypothetical protein AVEN_230438-1 [Araneus ventricosus]|uniref:Uncharacterized protein n=1 Tax=Araneus ventricosus TaxID=182803 RepID=A0A4Y2KP70_ARAVE|nr:hypothetical protein AVEN_230438-1 [Araneus ventricosus]